MKRILDNFQKKIYIKTPAKMDFASHKRQFTIERAWKHCVIKFIYYTYIIITHMQF